MAYHIISNSKPHGKVNAGDIGFYLKQDGEDVAVIGKVAGGKSYRIGTFEKEDGVFHLRPENSDLPLTTDSEGYVDTEWDEIIEDTPQDTEQLFSLLTSLETTLSALRNFLSR